MSDRVILVDGLGKKYRIGASRQRYKALRDQIADAAAKPFRAARALFGRNGRGAEEPEETEFWALKDVSFEIRQGEVVGVIGRNGAGKSTLLKILSRITEPTTGGVHIRGRVGSLLEVGTGFHPELTGRENIFLNGAILGMRKGEIERKFDEIVAFSEVEKFIDTAVKYYSSGMYLRLAFAVAAHLEPEILVVDEVLAVGDVAFQKKCMGKMGEVAHAGRTVIFVSHNLMAVQTLCTRALVLNQGALFLDAPDPGSAVGSYVGLTASHGSTWSRSPGSGSPESPLVFTKISITLADEQPHHRLLVELELRSVAPHSPAYIAIDLLDLLSIPILQAIPTPSPFIEYQSNPHRLTVEIALPPLIPGTYQIHPWVGPHNTTTFDFVRTGITFSVVSAPQKGRSFPYYNDHGFIVPFSRIMDHSVACPTERRYH